MPTAGPMLGNAVKQMVEERGINFNPQHKVVKIDLEKHEIYFENQRKASFDLLLFVPPHKAPDALEGSGLSGENGWIPVDVEGSWFLETGYGMAGYANGNFYAEPAPEIILRKPSMFWHFGKILFE